MAFSTDFTRKSSVFFTDLTRKIGVFCVNFILQKFCPCKNNDKLEVCQFKKVNVWVQRAFGNVLVDGEKASSGLLYLHFVEDTGVSTEILSLRATSKKQVRVVKKKTHPDCSSGNGPRPCNTVMNLGKKDPLGEALKKLFF